MKKQDGELTGERQEKGGMTDSKLHFHPIRKKLLIDLEGGGGRGGQKCLGCHARSRKNSNKRDGKKKGERSLEGKQGAPARSPSLSNWRKGKGVGNEIIPPMLLLGKTLEKDREEGELNKEVQPLTSTQGGSMYNDMKKKK